MNYYSPYKFTCQPGTTRAVIQANSNGSYSLKQESDYYPFVKRHEPISPENDNKYLYNSKELEDDLINGRKLDWYFYGARFYDPQIGRWHALDPLMEQYSSLSPYNYVGNNPVNRIDPDGMRMEAQTLEPYYKPPATWAETQFWDRQAEWKYWNSPEGRSSVGRDCGYGYNYDWNDGCYRDALGNKVSWSSVKKTIPWGSYEDIEGFVQFKPVKYSSGENGAVTGIAAAEPGEIDGTLCIVETGDGVFTFVVPYEVAGVDPSGQGGDASNSTAMWDYGGTVGDGMGSLFLTVATSAKQDAKYFNKVAATSTGVKQANAIRSLSTATKTFSYAKNFCTGLGLVGVGFTFMEGYSDGHMSAGDWTKVGLSAATFIPYVGWAYGLTDLGFKLTTGRSVSDRAGDWVDSL